jgi:Fe2+ transport system protein FeoA
MSLDQLLPGQSARIINISGIGNIRRRLLEMGIHSGDLVKMIKAAPLRDPLQISLPAGHLSIRRREAALISIEILSDKSCE